MSEGAAAGRKGDKPDQDRQAEEEGNEASVVPSDDRDMPMLVHVESSRGATLPALWMSTFPGRNYVSTNRAQQPPLQYKFRCSPEASSDSSPRAKRAKAVQQEGVYIGAPVPAQPLPLSPRQTSDSRVLSAGRNEPLQSRRNEPLQSRRNEPLQSVAESSNAAVAEPMATASSAAGGSSPPVTSAAQRLVERRRLPQSLRRSLWLSKEAVQGQAPSGHDSNASHAPVVSGAAPGRDSERSMAVAGGGAGGVPCLLPISIGGNTVYSVVSLPPTGQWPGALPMVTGGGGSLATVRDQPVAAAVGGPTAGHYPLMLYGGNVLPAHAYQAMGTGAALPGAGTVAMMAPPGYAGLPVGVQAPVGPYYTLNPHAPLVQLPGAVPSQAALQSWIQPIGQAVGQTQEKAMGKHEEQGGRSTDDQDHHHGDRTHEHQQGILSRANPPQNLSVGTTRRYIDRPSSQLKKETEERLAASSTQDASLYIMRSGCLVVYVGHSGEGSDQFGWRTLVDLPTDCISLACVGKSVVCVAQRKLWTLQERRWITCLQVDDVTAICGQEGSTELLACRGERLLTRNWKSSDQEDHWRLVCDCPPFVSLARYKSVVFGVSGKVLQFADIRKAKSTSVGWQKTLQSRDMSAEVVAVVGDSIYIVAEQNVYSASLRDWPLESAALTAVCVLHWNFVCAAGRVVAMTGGPVSCSIAPSSAPAPPKMSETPLSPVRPAASSLSSTAGDTHRDHESLYLFTESAGLWRMTEKNGVFGYVSQLPWKPTALAFLAGRAYAASQRCLYSASLQPSISGSGATLSSWSQVGETPFLTAMVSHKGCLFGLGEQLLWRRDDMSANGGWVAIGRAPDSTAIASASGNLFIASSNKLYCQPPNNDNQVVAAWYEVGPASQVWSMTAAGGHLYSLCGNVLWSAPVNASPNHKHVWSRYCSTQGVAGLASGPADVAVTASSEPVAAIAMSDGGQTQPDSTTGPSSDKDSSKSLVLPSKSREMHTRRQ